MAAACTSCRAGSAWPRAKELIFTGRTLTADEALAIGMLERVTTPDALLAEAVAWAARASAGLARGAGAGQGDP